MHRLRQKDATLELVQFTDPHLFADRRGEMRGTNTFASMNRVLDAAQRNHWPPDAVLVTGDIAQDESREGYRVFRSAMEPLALPVLCIPGNHDDPEYMRQELDGNFRVLEPVRFDRWRILLLSTYVPGTACGELDRHTLDATEQALREFPDEHFLVCLHHQPVPVGSHWLDGVGLRNPESLFRVLDRHAHVRALVWGHVHQEFDDERNGVRLLATPSTCRQFLPRSETFALDDLPPAYRWLRLEPDGAIATGVEYVPD